MEIMTEAHKLISGDLCYIDSDTARMLHGAGATAILACAEVVCVEFPEVSPDDTPDIGPIY